MSLKQKKHSENKKEQSRLQEKMEKRKKKNGYSITTTIYLHHK